MDDCYLWMDVMDRSIDGCNGWMDRWMLSMNGEWMDRITE
jgi:hypothetical protein